MDSVVIVNLISLLVPFFVTATWILIVIAITKGYLSVKRDLAEIKKELHELKNKV